MIKTNLINKVIKLNNLEKDKRYNLILRLSNTDITMEDLKSSEVYHEIDVLSINCGFIEHPLIYFITEYKSKNL